MGQVESKKPQWQRAITTVTVNTDNHSLFQTILQRETLSGKQHFLQRIIKVLKRGMN